VPAPMREFLQDDDRAAATVFCRYVVVIDNPFSPRGEEATGEFLQRYPSTTAWSTTKRAPTRRRPKSCGEPSPTSWSTPI